MAHRTASSTMAIVTACIMIAVGGLPPFTFGAHLAPCSTPVPEDDMRANWILAEGRPFLPANRDRFFTFNHPDWRDVPPVENLTGPALTEEETRGALQTFLERRFPCAPERVQDGLGTYGDPVARQKVPNPTLRAALAALTGTLGEPAIEFLLYRTPVTLIDFGIYVEPETGAPGRIGGTSVSPDGTRDIVIDREYRFDPFGAFSALLVHEALHTGEDDDTAGLPEEATASSVEALVYMQMLLTDPTLASLPDELTRMSNNHVALVRLNSGPAGSERLTLFVPGSDTNIDPLAVEPLTEFYEYYDRYSAPDDPDFRERETAGNWLLWEILGHLSDPDTHEARDGANFDAETLAFVDQHQAVLAPAELIAVACILELDVPCD